MIELIDKISALIKNNRTFCLVTVVETRGTTPRKAGAKAIVLEDGTAFGTIGGGSIESYAINHALEVLKNKKPDLNVYELDQLEDQMSCGGAMTLFYEPFYPQRHLTIFGGGHVGRALSHAARVAGWKVTVVDHRPEVLNREFFPDEVELISQAYSSYIESNSFDETDWIVIVTPQHQYDEDVLRNMLPHRVAYMGMMGSITKVSEIRTSLLNKGIKAHELTHVHAPIGLNIGTETPGEIAISIVAEMQAVLHRLDTIKSCKIM
ncbi:XdhC family protein [candidate division KSB1 bacterium]|nr:XdhC family protein [candidate division KSB1 bacterium]